MSRFLSENMKQFQPYTPGEQPRDKKYIKLNTNECPYSPSLLVREAIAGFRADDLRLYPDPDSTEFKQAAAKSYNLDSDMVFAGGGSDEILAYAFMAFFDKADKVYFPDITYGFYSVYAALFSLEIAELPLDSSFRVNVSDYFGLDGNIFLANPNAPTGICLNPADIELILQNNPDRLLILDEAYIDFAPGKSCVGLVERYDNLLVVQTFSKSRAMAGMRLGLGFGNKELIAGLERVKYSFNPYNLDRVSVAAGIAALRDREYLSMITGKIIRTRENVIERLKNHCFEILPSDANFIFARHPSLSGETLYTSLREKGVLVRHFAKPRISDYVRITIGSDADMSVLLDKISEILREAAG